MVSFVDSRTNDFIVILMRIDQKIIHRNLPVINASNGLTKIPSSVFFKIPPMVIFAVPVVTNSVDRCISTGLITLTPMARSAARIVEVKYNMTILENLESKPVVPPIIESSTRKNTRTGATAYAPQ